MNVLRKKSLRYAYHSLQCFSRLFPPSYSTSSASNEIFSYASSNLFFNTEHYNTQPVYMDTIELSSIQLCNKNNSFSLLVFFSFCAC